MQTQRSERTSDISDPVTITAWSTGSSQPYITITITITNEQSTYPTGRSPTPRTSLWTTVTVQHSAFYVCTVDSPAHHTRHTPDPPDRIGRQLTDSSDGLAGARAGKSWCPQRKRICDGRAGLESRELQTRTRRGGGKDVEHEHEAGPGKLNCASTWYLRK